MTKHVYGWKPDLPDFRDHSVKMGSVFLSATKLPASVDLRPFCSRIENQGNLNSCTSFALVGAMELLEGKRQQEFVELSHLFPWWNTRNYEGTTRENTGAYIRDTIKAAASLGVCVETLWPYNETKYRERPSTNAYQDAAHRRITEYVRVSPEVSMVRGILASGFPVIIGLTLYDSFESADVARTGMVRMPDRNEHCLGGHAVLIVGYDDDQNRFIVRNSWGTQWGDKGYFRLPYAYLETAGLASDLWTIRN